jgi:hypothetical protein
MHPPEGHSDNRSTNLDRSDCSADEDRGKGGRKSMYIWCYLHALKDE